MIVCVCVCVYRRACLRVYLTGDSVAAMLAEQEHLLQERNVFGNLTSLLFSSRDPIHGQPHEIQNLHIHTKTKKGRGASEIVPVNHRPYLGTLRTGFLHPGHPMHAFVLECGIPLLGKPPRTTVGSLHPLTTDPNLVPTPSRPDGGEYYKHQPFHRVR